MAIITVDLLTDFANKFAAKITEKFVKKTDIPDNAKFTDTTYSDMGGASSSAAGTHGLVPAPAKGSQNKYLRGDGTWQTPPDNNTTYSDMTAATASGAGTHGLVPAPAAGEQGKYLRGDGTWQTPTNTTYSAATTGKAGLMSVADKVKLDGITEATTADIDSIIAETFSVVSESH